MNFLIKTVIVSSILGVPTSFISAQNTAWIENFADGLLENVFPLLVTILSAFAVVYFVWGVVLFIAQSSNDKAREDGKQRMIWGVVALFVLVSVWGLVVLLQTVLGIDSNSPPSAPQTSYNTLQDNHLI